MDANVELIGMVCALIVQAAGTVWWAATLNNKVESLFGKVDGLEDRFSNIEVEQRQQDKSLASINTLMARLDERTEAMVKTMDRMEKRFDAQQALP
jgi:uncharacterized coiled-coil protein SlyX